MTLHYRIFQISLLVMVDILISCQASSRTVDLFSSCSGMLPAESWQITVLSGASGRRESLCPDSQPFPKAACTQRLNSAGVSKSNPLAPIREKSEGLSQSQHLSFSREMTEPQLNFSCWQTFFHSFPSPEVDPKSLLNKPHGC